MAQVARTVGSNATDTRRRILAASAQVFAEHGYSGASMRDIAERLGITKAALYYHFRSKEDLLDGLVQPVMAAMSDFARDAEAGRFTPAQILRGFLDLTVEGVPGLFPLMIDQGAREAIKTRYDLQETTRRIEGVLARMVGAAADAVGGAVKDAGPRDEAARPGRSGGSGRDLAECTLRAQFALGGIRAMVLSRLFAAMQAISGADECAPSGRPNRTSADGNGARGADEARAGAEDRAVGGGAEPAHDEDEDESEGRDESHGSPDGGAVPRAGRRVLAAAFAQLDDRPQLLTDSERDIVVDSALAGLR